MLAMMVDQRLRAREESREAYWLRHPSTASVKLRCRASTARHCLHILPGESILEIGAGSGLWTEHLTGVLKGENPITAVVFDQKFANQGSRKRLPNTCFTLVDSLLDLPAASFDYVVGTLMLSHDHVAESLQALYRLLKPGGMLLFFELNHSNPAHIASQQGFTDIQFIPYDILYSGLPRSVVRTVQPMAFVLEQLPLMRRLCGSALISAQKPGIRSKECTAALATHKALFHSASVVVPCKNEEQTAPKLISELLRLYGDYIHEILIVNDNSSDRTAECVLEIAAQDPRIKLINRQPPNGVGRALRDGYAAASGRYILSLDCDFVHLLHEIRDLFAVVAAGHDGAIGSRFSHESVLIAYPWAKMLCNRTFHLLLNMFLPTPVHDISNNLKLYRAEVLKELPIRQNGFAANVETGIVPILDGYDIREVAISWIGRTADMGSSSFRLLGVAPDYIQVLWRLVFGARRPKKQLLRHPDFDRSKRDA